MNNQFIENIEAEQSILGSILLEKDCIDKIDDYLKIDDFNREAHKKIYECMLELNKKREKHSLLSFFMLYQFICRCCPRHRIPS